MPLWEPARATGWELVGVFVWLTDPYTSSHRRRPRAGFMAGMHNCSAVTATGFMAEAEQRPLLQPNYPVPVISHV